MASNYRPTLYKTEKGTECESYAKDRRAIPLDIMPGNVVDIGFYYNQWREESQKISMNDEDFAAFLLQFCNFVTRQDTDRIYRSHLSDFVATYKVNKEFRLKDCIPKSLSDVDSLIFIEKYFNLWKEKKSALSMNDEEFAGYLLHLWKYSSNPFSNCATELEVNAQAPLDNKAFVTIATNDNYAMGALVLGYSLRRVGTQHKLVVLLTPEVTSPVRLKLEQVFDEVQNVDLLDSKDDVHLSLMARPELGSTFTKLHIWKLHQYSKCVFLDADTLVCKNCDELFEREELSAAPDIGWPDCFNSGVFVFVPSLETFENLLKLAVEQGSFDGGDQGLLNTYFSDWATQDIRKHLSFIYNMVTSSSYTYIPAYKYFGHRVKIAHFLGAMKPWMHDHRNDENEFEPCTQCLSSAEFYKLWWEIYTESIVDSSSPIEETCEEVSNLVLVSSPDYTPSVPSLEDRKTSWEQGQIDYLGADSFDNIQRKLEESINSKK